MQNITATFLNNELLCGGHQRLGDYVRESAWVLLAVKYAQGKNNSASKAGDFINHAIFLEQELEHAIKLLSHTSLLQVNGNIFILGSFFPNFWKKPGAGKHRSVHKQLEKITNALHNL
jgi:hypothetical protein